MGNLIKAQANVNVSKQENIQATSSEFLQESLLNGTSSPISRSFDNLSFRTTGTIKNIQTDGVAWNFNKSLGIKNAEKVFVYYYSSNTGIISIIERVDVYTLNLTFYKVVYSISSDGISSTETYLGNIVFTEGDYPIYAGDIDAYYYSGSVHFLFGYYIRNSSALIPWSYYFYNITYDGASIYSQLITNDYGKIKSVRTFTIAGKQYYAIAIIGMYLADLYSGQTLAGNATVIFSSMDGVNTGKIVINRPGFLKASPPPEEIYLSDVKYSSGRSLAVSFITIKWSESDSWIYYLTYDGLITTSNTEIYSTEDSQLLGDFTNIRMTLISDYICGFFIEYIENQRYLEYIYYNDNLDTVEVSTLDVGNAPSSILLSDLNESDDLIRLYMIDQISASTEVYSLYIQISNPGLESPTVLSLFKVTDTGTNTIGYYISTNSTEQSMLLTHISYNNLGNKTVSYIVGFKDSDKDGLGDRVEIAMTLNAFDDDTDDDLIHDGSEYYLYHTSPKLNDTDRDNLTDYYELVDYGTDPLDTDTDNDSLTDWQELVKFESDPLSIDTDGDGLNDTLELIIGYNITILLANGTEISITVYLNASDPDSDNDSLDDYFEYENLLNGMSNDTDMDNLTDTLELERSTSPTMQDTDGDGLTDWQEIAVYLTNPKYKDTDNDQVDDYLEVMVYKTNPLVSDSDFDDISDYQEIFNYGTNPNSDDTDNDNITDYDELFVHGTNPCLNDTDYDNITDWQEIFGINITGIGVRNLDPTSNDTDGDGLTDWQEVFVFKTDPTEIDTDGDGLDDNLEVHNSQLNPVLEDTDDDGLSDSEEYYIYGTRPDLNDTDSDGLSDYEEVVVAGTDPWNTDSDGDQLSDYEELKVYGTNPLSPDTDGDGLDDPIEIFSTKTDPRIPDTDGDGLSDSQEETIGTDPLKNDTDQDKILDALEVQFGTNPLKNDTDNDGLDDYLEIFTYSTNPNFNDTDNDGLTDLQEIKLGTDPLRKDTDNDGLSDGDEENKFGTNPLKNDTDADGLTDGEEIYTYGTNPKSADTDHDGIPDNEDPFPRDNDIIRSAFLIIALLIGGALVHLNSSGTFKDWKKDIILLGLADEGGTPMLAIPEDVANKYNINLVSSALSGMYMLTEEISGKKGILVIGGKPATIVVKGDGLFLWAITKKSYKKLEKSLKNLTDTLTKKYGQILSSWSGDVEELRDVETFLKSTLELAEKIETVELESPDEKELEKVIDVGDLDLNL